MYFSKEKNTVKKLIVLVIAFKSEFRPFKLLFFWDYKLEGNFKECKIFIKKQFQLLYLIYLTCTNSFQYNALGNLWNLFIFV